MAGHTIVSAPTGEGFATPLFEFLTRPNNAAHEDIRLELMGTLLLSRATVLFGAVSIAILLGAIALLHDPLIASIAGVPFLITVLARLRLIGQFKGRMLGASDVARIVTSGLAYAATISLVGFAASWSGQPALVITGALVMTGMVFGFCISNAGAPRYAEAQTLVVTVPFLLGTALSGPPEMLMILIPAPVWLLGLHGLIGTTHARLAQLVEAQRKNRYLAYNDLLTGLANRAQVMFSLRQLAEDRTRRPHPPYVLYLDLDGFKGVNDTYGHAVGDLLLRAVAQRLSAEVRASDIVGRIGGDEFVIILRDMSPSDITQLSGRLAETIGKPFALTASIDAQIGVSIGGAPLGLNVEDAIAEADSRLYQAKHGGRGRFYLSGI